MNCCDTCGSGMKPLFVSLYCPVCDVRDAGKRDDMIRTPISQLQLKKGEFFVYDVVGKDQNMRWLHTHDSAYSYVEKHADTSLDWYAWVLDSSWSVKRSVSNLVTVFNDDEGLKLRPIGPLSHDEIEWAKAQK